MRRLKKSNGVGLDEPITNKQWAIAITLLLSPVWVLIFINLLGDYYKAYPDTPEKPKFKYDYIAREPDIVYKEPKFKSGRDQLIPENKYGGGVVLQLHGAVIETGLTSEEILEQLSFDYQDIYDQYGGAYGLY